MTPGNGSVHRLSIIPDRYSIVEIISRCKFTKALASRCVNIYRGKVVQFRSEVLWVVELWLIVGALELASERAELLRTSGPTRRGRGRSDKTLCTVASRGYTRAIPKTKNKKYERAHAPPLVLSTAYDIDAPTVFLSLGNRVKKNIAHASHSLAQISTHYCPLVESVKLDADERPFGIAAHFSSGSILKLSSFRLHENIDSKRFRTFQRAKWHRTLQSHGKLYIFLFNINIVYYLWEY